MVNWQQLQGRMMTVTAYNVEGEIEVMRRRKQANYIRTWWGILTDLGHNVRVVLSVEPDGVIAEFVRQVEQEQGT